MAKYSTFKYGSGTHYGTGSAVAITAAVSGIQWILQIDWNNDKIFDGTNEAQYMVNLTIRRGRQFYLAPGGNNFEVMPPGTATITLDNHDGRYDPYNTGSALYPYVKPGRRLLIMAKDTTTGTTHPVYKGNVKDIVPVSGGADQVQIIATDGIQWLMDSEVSIPAKFNINISNAIKATLAAAHYPWATNITARTQPIAVFDPDKQNAYSVICDLANGSLGTFFCDRYGFARYYPLNYNSMTSHSLDQAALLKEIMVASPWENIRNTLRVNCRRRGKRPLSTIWTSMTPEYLEKSTSTSFDITYPETVEVRQPDSSDFSANTVSDGSGTDLTSGWSAVLSDIEPTGCTVTIANNSGQDGYMTWLIINGRQLAESNLVIKAQDDTSRNAYGIRKFELTNPWLQDKGYATAFATLLKTHLKDPQENPVIQIEQTPAVQLPIDLMDKIVLTSAHLGISKTFKVGGLEHSITFGTGQGLVTKLYLQDVIYSATSITPSTYYPSGGGIEQVPEMTNPAIDYGYFLPPTAQEGVYCYNLGFQWEQDDAPFDFTNDLDRQVSDGDCILQNPSTFLTATHPTRITFPYSGIYSVMIRPYVHVHFTNDTLGVLQITYLPTFYDSLGSGAGLPGTMDNADEIIVDIRAIVGMTSIYGQGQGTYLANVPAGYYMEIARTYVASAYVDDSTIETGMQVAVYLLSPT